MTEPSAESPSIRDLVRAVRGRVPVDAAELLAQEAPDTIAAVLAALPADLARRITMELPENLRQQTEGEDAKAPESVSDLVEPARGVLDSGTTVQQAIDYLRDADSVTEITYLYIVDGAKKLLGLVVMRDLLLAQPAQPIDDIMIRRPYAFNPAMSIGDAIKAAVKRHYPVYPVVDAEGKLVGSVRGWRLAQQQAIEISAQSGQMVGINKLERATTGIWEAFKMRHPWLQLNLLTAFLAGFVVSMFEGTISQIVALAAFLPILAGQSGNNGCQALAITLRGITLGDTDAHPVSKLIAKEAVLGAMNGIFTGVIAGAAMWWSAGGLHGNPQALMLAGVILVAMTLACMASGLFGVLIPLFLRKVGADPSTASAIFLTTGTDISSMGLMLLLATVLVLH